MMKIERGGNHSIFLASNGTVYHHGSSYSNYTADMEVPTQISSSLKIRYVKCGESHCLAIGYNRKLYGWGDNSRGQLGHGMMIATSPSRLNILRDYDIVDIDCGNNHSYCKTSDDQHWLFGDYYCNQCLDYRTERNYIREPNLITNILERKYVINSVRLGFENTKIIVVFV